MTLSIIFKWQIISEVVALILFFNMNTPTFNTGGDLLWLRGTILLFAIVNLAILSYLLGMYMIQNGLKGFINHIK